MTTTSLPTTTTGVRLYGPLSRTGNCWVAICEGAISVYRPCPNKFLKLHSLVVIPERDDTAGRPGRRYGFSVPHCWCTGGAADDGRHFAFVTGTTFVRIWKLKESTSHVEEVKQIETLVEDSIDCLAVAINRYVAVSSSKKKIDIYEYGSGEKLHTLCDAVNDVSCHAGDGSDMKLRMESVGDLLVTTPHMYNDMCVWNARRGELLARYDIPMHFLEGGGNRVPPEVLGMVRLKHLPNTFVTVSRRLCVWAFPKDETSREAIESIEDRENEIASGLRG